MVRALQETDSRIHKSGADDGREGDCICRNGCNKGGVNSWTDGDRGISYYLPLS